MLSRFSRLAICICSTVTVVTTHAQIYLADNGLTASGTSTSKLVSLGGTLNNAATTVDFGSGNSSSNFLFKKGVANYLFVANGGNVGIGTITPGTLLDVNGSVNITGATTIGGANPNSPAQLTINYSGGGVYSGKGIRLVETSAGSVVRLHSILNSLYLTNDAGQPAGLLLGTRINPVDASEFRAGAQRWEIRAGSFSVNQDWTGNGQLEMTITTAARKGILVKAAASQTANLQEWQNSSATALSVVTSAGSMGINTASPNVNAKLDVNGNIFSSGKIAIGTTDMAKISTYSLAVNGDALFNKVKVKLYASWPDYVFKETYKLRPIREVEAFIRQHNHLPEVPSAREVEDNGLDLGDNQTILLKKIEELTLYIIEQNKRMDEQDKKIRQLEEQTRKK